MRVWLLSSGSSGNLAIVEAEGHRLMIDAGVGLRSAVTRMKALGADLFPKSVSGVVITHHHGDHMGQVQPLLKALRAPLFLHRGIEADVVRRRVDAREYTPGTTLRVGPFEIDALSIPHDAPQVAVTVSAGGRRFGIVTDLGHVPPGLAAMLAGCDAALVEANYCHHLLPLGPYPPRLRDRVAGDRGHLSNVQTGELAARLVSTRLGKLYLGHISRANNTVERALETVRGRARGLEVDAVPHGVPCLIEVGGRLTQMPLPFAPAVGSP